MFTSRAVTTAFRAFYDNLFWSFVFLIGTFILVLEFRFPHWRNLHLPPHLQPLFR